MTQGFKIARIGQPGLTLGADEALKTSGTPSGDEWKYPETLFFCSGIWKVGTEVAAYDETNAVTFTGVTVDTVNDRIPYAKHRFHEGEPISFSGAGRPATTGHGSPISTAQQFYVHVVDKDTIEVHGSRQMDDKVDFTSSGSGAAWFITRNYWFYSEEKNSGSNGRELYNTIGAPTYRPAAGDVSNFRWPAADTWWDVGFMVSTMDLSMGGMLEGDITGKMKHGGTGNRVLYLVLDPDPNVKADGFAGEVLFTATVVAATDIWTKTAHGLKNRDVVQTKENGAAASVATPGTNYWVRRIDADTFYLCTDPELATIADIASDGEMNICKPASGSRNRIRFAFSVPNTVSVVQSIAITDATWTLGTLTLEKTGAFIPYWPRVAEIDTGYDGPLGDYWHTDTTDGGWTDEKRYPVASREDDDTITLLDPDGDAPADNAVSDGTLVHLDFVDFRLRWWFVKDLGEQSISSAVSCGTWFAELTIYANSLYADPATSSDGLVIRQSVNRSFPRQGTNFTEVRRHDWGPVSKIEYFEEWPSFQYAVDEEITGGTSGAVGIVVEHDLNRQTILYRPKADDEDFQPGETLTGSSGSMTCGTVMRGPLPTIVSQRIAVDGVQDGSFDVRVLSSRVTLHRVRPS